MGHSRVSVLGRLVVFWGIPGVRGGGHARFVRWCIYLGLGVNLEKSSLVPSRQLVHLGVEWNFESASGSFLHPLKASRSPWRLSTWPRRRLSRFLVLSLSSEASGSREVCPVWSRSFSPYSASTYFELRSVRSFRWVTLSDDARADCRWWSDRASAVTLGPGSSSETVVSSIYRCVDTRLGRLVRDAHCQWRVVDCPENLAHQHSGDACDLSCSESLVCQMSRSDSPHLL